MKRAKYRPPYHAVRVARSDDRFRRFAEALPTISKAATACTMSMFEMATALRRVAAAMPTTADVARSLRAHFSTA